MEPIAIVTVLSKLISIGIKMNKARAGEGFDEEDLQALQTVLDGGSSIASSFKGKSEAKPAALQLALTARAFGQALARHWGGSTSVTAWWNKSERRRSKEIELRTKHAALKIVEPGDRPSGEAELQLLGALTGLPQNNPYYRALWAAFSNPDLARKDEEDECGEEELLLQPGDGDARQFERHFRLAFGEAMATAAGQQVQHWQSELVRETPELMRDVLARDLEDWGSRHVFGNTQKQAEGDPLPFMSLDETYVEPLGQLGRDGRPEEIQGLITNLLEQNHLVVVQADFGHGKSLSARRLARDLARKHITSESVGVDLLYPVFIKCARDINDGYVHEQAIRTSLWNSARESIGPVWSREFPGFDRPSSEQCTLFILDGLDELAFGESQLRSLFQRLGEALSGRHKAVVFTRPGALPTRCLPKGTPVITIQQFEDPQIRRWLAAWSRLPGQSSIGLDRLPAHLRELAATPILLLMIATTWMPGDQTPALGRAALYEKFFQQIARGKHEADTDAHNQIADASRALLERLCQTGDLASEETDLVAAMLWMMSRVAWEDHLLARGDSPKELKTRHVENLLDEYDLAADLAPKITIGLLVALQHNPDGGSANLLFGHQSFREFLVARYWKSQLLKLTRDRDSGQQIAKKLMKGRLLHHEDRSFDFLREMLVDVGEHERRTILSWAEDVANDEELSAKRLQDDEHSRLRESMIAIGSVLSREGLRMRDTSKLRSLLAWFYLKRENLIVYAPHLRHEGAYLDGAYLDGAYLEGANLQGANLQGANLQGANLQGANLEGANLMGANLMGADLSGAQLQMARLEGANLVEASLVRAHLEGARLVGTKLQMARLEGAHLEGARFNTARLQGAKGLTSPQLREASGYPSDLLRELEAQEAAQRDLNPKTPDGFRSGDPQL